VTQLLLQLPPSVLEKLKEQLRMGFLVSPYSAAAVSSAVGPSHCQMALEGLEQLYGQGISNRGVAALLDAVEMARREIPRPSLVWTGPEVSGLHARDTRRVFDELIGRAVSSLWISTYAFFEGKKAFESLASRMDAVPELEVTLLLNVDRKSHHGSAEEAIQKAGVNLWKYGWPGERRPRVYYFPEALEEDRSARAVLHAKAIVRDASEVLVTSANFTEAALDRNIELGVLLHDAPLAQHVVRHYQRLIEEGRLALLP
jgi:phosphatidylserine/phosphatidylglycerophosphate/cardiolipin synthase-like enzyme